MNPINAKDIRPAVIRDIGAPLKGSGVVAKSSLSLMAANSIITNEKPIAALKP